MSKTMIIVLSGFFLFTGCAVGPDFHRPPAPDIEAYTATALPAQTVAAPVMGGASQQFKTADHISGQWWQIFQCEALDRLVRRGMAENFTIAAAQAALRQARELAQAQYGTTWFPSLDARFSAERQKTNGASFGQAGVGQDRFDLFNASVNVSYLLDIFGGQRRQLEALRSRIDYQSYQLQGSYLTLSANIVTTALQEASLRAQLKATREIIADQQEAYQLLQRQFQLGALSRTEVLIQKTQLAQTRATLPPLEKNLSQTRHRLAVLTGLFPGEAGKLPKIDIGKITLPTELPVTLPSALVRQRPDIQASEALLHAASAQVGVATANLYPNITLTAGYGVISNDIDRLFRNDSTFWSFGGNLLQPIFRGGALRAKRRAAVAAFDEAAANYRQTVLQAFLNVADVLRALETDARALKAEYEAESAAEESLTLTKKQYSVGAVSYLTLLAAQRQYQQSRISLIQAQTVRYADTAALFQALGGGWLSPPALDQDAAGQKSLKMKDQEG